MQIRRDGMDDVLQAELGIEPIMLRDTDQSTIDSDRSPVIPRTISTDDGSDVPSELPVSMSDELPSNDRLPADMSNELPDDGYRVFNLRTQKVELSRSVIFDEKAMWDWESNESMQVSIPWNDEGSSRISEFDPESISISGTYDHTPHKWKSLSDVYAQCNMSIIEPKDFSEAVKDEAWKKTMIEEMLMIEKNSTWELVDKPSSKPVVGVKWIYKTKLNLNGSIQKHKARLVAKGYTQKPGIDFNETFAQTARLNTIRTLIALAAQRGWKLWQLDVK
nr:uncharacterized protein LOC114825742 [Malus domestica]